MPRIYDTGDTHGNFRRLTKKRRMRLPFSLKDDYIIVNGDFGLCRANDKEFRYNCEWLSNLPFVILFVDGNHENYTMLNEYPIEMWHGGKVHHIIRDKIIHLMRGQIFSIEGKTFFTMGGAESQGYTGGILDMSDPYYSLKRRQAVKEDRPYCVIGKSYWFEELPSQEELDEGLNNLAKHNFRVDYIISHCLADSIVCKDKELKYSGNQLTKYFDEIEKRVQYKHWYCGHYHKDVRFDDKHTVVYKDIIEIK